MDIIPLVNYYHCCYLDKKSGCSYIIPLSIKINHLWISHKSLPPVSSAPWLVGKSTMNTSMIFPKTSMNSLVISQLCLMTPEGHWSFTIPAGVTGGPTKLRLFWRPCSAVSPRAPRKYECFYMCLHKKNYCRLCLAPFRPTAKNDNIDTFARWKEPGICGVFSKPLQDQDGAPPVIS